MSSQMTRITQDLHQAFETKFASQGTCMLSVAAVQELTDGFWNLLTQRLTGQTPADTLLARCAELLTKQLELALCLQKQKEVTQQAREITARFIAGLPQIQQTLFTDIRAAYEGDPAAVNEMETLLCYPGVLAVTYQRMAHVLYEQGVRVLPRMMTEIAHQRTGIDIHPGAQIGPAFFIDHGTGVVIGETSVIGAHVKLYQGVTLGAKSFPLDDQGHPIKGIKRHPNIGDDVIIYAETTILGNITVGNGAVIGANKWITQDVPPHTKID